MHLGDLNFQHCIGSIPTTDTTDEGGCSNIDEEVVVSEFEYSVDKFFEVSEVISSLCGEQPLTIDSNEIQHSSSTITFLEDWEHFYHDPKIVNFTYEAQSPSLTKYAAKDIHLPQFSSVSVPKASCLQMKEPSSDKARKLNCDDFLLHAGGSIWALDWCPGVSKRPDSLKNSEYLAVSAHPPGSSYHQMGIPLSGRGIIQIWCILSAKEEEKSQLDYNHMLNSSSRQRKGHSRKKHFELNPLGNIDEKTLPAKPRGRPRKQPMVIEHLSNSDDEYLPPKPKRPRGRPRKQLDGECQSSEPKSTGGRARKKLDGEYMSSQSKRPRGRPRKQPKSATRRKPRKQPELVEFVNVSSENDMPICQLAYGFEQDEDLKDAKANGVFALRSKMNRNDEIESSIGLTFQEKGKLLIEGSAKEKHDGKYTSSQPKRPRGRPRKQPESATKGKPRKQPESVEFANVLSKNDMLICQLPYDSKQDEDSRDVKGNKVSVLRSKMNRNDEIESSVGLTFQEKGKLLTGGRARKKLDREYTSSQPKRPRGRPRKQTELATKGEPRKQPESVEFANISTENDMPVCQLPYSFEQNEDLRDVKANEISILRNKMNRIDEIESSARLTFQEKSCPPRLDGGSHKKMVGLLKFLNAKENNNELGESSLTVHASNEIDRNIKADEKIFGKTLDDLSNGQRLSLTRSGRGRPRKKHAHGEMSDVRREQSFSKPVKDLTTMESFDASNGMDVLGLSNCSPLQLEFPRHGSYRDFHEKSDLRCVVVEKHIDKTLDGLGIKEKQSLTCQYKGKFDNKLVGVESIDNQSDQSISYATRCDTGDNLRERILANATGTGKQINQEWLRRKSICMKSSYDSNGMDVLNIFEVQENGPISLRSKFANSSHEIEISCEERNQQPNKSMYLNKGKLSPSSLCNVDIRNELAKVNSLDDMFSVENLSTAMSHISFNRLLGEDPLLFPNDASSELVREHHSPIVMKYNLDEVCTPKDCKESNLQNVDPENSVIKHTRKRKIKDMARKVTSISDAPIFSKIEDGKQLCVHDNPSPVQSHGQALVSEVEHVRPLKMNYSNNHKNVTLPRVVLCLGHMGKVAWDIKWRPQSANNLEEDKHTLGYLAAVLGDGSLEVWEVPLLGKVQILYNSCGKKGTDPRFIRLKPVFRCSVLKCGDKKSIPLSVEWSPGSPSDLILAGCHDGTVALWKFIAEDSSLDTRPLICFTADSVPIRAVAWAPDNCDTESANLFVTAGNERLRFWDMRDPYHPLWEFNPVKRHILSVDWFKNPSCIMLSFDDGALRIISLSKATSGELLAGSKGKHHYYYCSTFPIWSVQISRVTGQVAYCGADGLTSRFQLTMKAVEKDASRHREPHFLCGSLVDEDQHLCISIPFPGVPLEDTPQHGRSLHQDSNHARIENSNAAGDSIAVVPYSGRSQNNFGCKVSSKLKERNVEEGIRTEVTNLIDVTGDKEEGNVQGRGIQVELGVMKDVFPSKNIAMHKVRWNMNHGSERWLCYGGAAGIVRCQEVPLPDL